VIHKEGLCPSSREINILMMNEEKALLKDQYYTHAPVFNVFYIDRELNEHERGRIEEVDLIKDRLRV
jgi:hypothetical protein